MASKRALTGGTGDVNPQTIGIYLAQATLNSYVHTAITIPRPQMLTKGKATVMELLRATIIWPDVQAAAAGIAYGRSFIGLSTKLGLSAPLDLDEPACIFNRQRVHVNAFTALGSLYTVFERNQDFEFTDGAGHGILIGADTLFFSLLTNGFAAPTHIHGKFYYRFKTIGLAEYIGIVQSMAV